MNALSLRWPGERFERLPILNTPTDRLPTMLPGNVTRADLRRLHDVIARGEVGPLMDPNEGLRHHFAPGMYGRELTIQAGRMLVGKIHRHEHLVTLMAGTAVIVTDQGRERITGPMVWVSPAGVQRAVVTLTECVFLTVHLNPTDTIDLAELEADIIVPGALDYDDDVDGQGLSDALQRAYA